MTVNRSCDPLKTALELPMLVEIKLFFLFHFYKNLSLLLVNKCLDE